MEKDNEELVDVDQETDIDGENVIGSMDTPENGGDALRHVDVQEFNDSLENDDPLKNEEECDDNNEQKSRKKYFKQIYYFYCFCLLISQLIDNVDFFNNLASC